MRKSMKIMLGAFAATIAFGTWGVAETAEKNAVAETPTYTLETLNLEMQYGASVRMRENADEAGIRYSMTMPTAAYEYLMANTDIADVTFGMFVAPNTYHTRYPMNEEANVLGENRKYGWLKEDETVWEESADYEANNKLVQILNVEGVVMTADQNSTDTMRFNGAVVGMLEANLCKEYVGTGYIRYTQDGATKYIFAKENDNVRSVVYVAQKALEDTSANAPTAEQKATLTEQYINKESVKATASNLTVQYYLRGEDGEYKLDATKTQTIASTVAAKKKIAYEDLNTIQGYVFNENFNAQLQEVTVYANDKTPAIRVNMEGALLYDFENVASIWDVFNSNGGNAAFTTLEGYEANGKMLKFAFGSNSWVSTPWNQWNKTILERGIEAGYTYLVADVYFDLNTATGASLKLFNTTEKYVTESGMYRVNFPLTTLEDNVIFWGSDISAEIYVDNIRFSNELYLYDGRIAENLYSYTNATITSDTTKGENVAKIIATNNTGMTIGFVYPFGGGWDWDNVYTKYAGKTLKFSIFLEKASWVNVGYITEYATSKYYATVGEWIEISVKVSDLQAKGKWVTLNLNEPQTYYLKDFKIV